jgi:hypothetical protein
MPYHIKKPSVLKAGATVYHTGGSNWTETFADRRVYTEDPTALTDNTDGTNGGFDGSTVVSE